MKKFVENWKFEGERFNLVEVRNIVRNESDSYSHWLGTGLVFTAEDGEKTIKANEVISIERTHKSIVNNEFGDIIAVRTKTAVYFMFMCDINQKFRFELKSL